MRVRTNLRTHLSLNLLILAACAGIITSCGGGGSTSSISQIPGPLGQQPSASPTPTSTAGASGYNGVSALYDTTGALDAAVLSDPNVDGLALRSHWNNIENTEGTYTYNYLLKQLSAAAQAHKWVALSIEAGHTTPSWVYADGVPKFTTVVARAAAYDACATVHFPVPYGSLYLQKWTALIQNLGAALAPYSSTIRVVKITGINSNSEETILPSDPGGTVVHLADGRSCTSNNDIAEWQSFGYNTQLMQSAFNQITSAWAQAFPNAEIALMYDKNGFPPLGADGSSDSSASDFANQLATGARATYGQRFIAQNNGLSTYIDPEIVALAQSGPTGYQMLWGATGDSTCRLNNGVTPCNANTDLYNALHLAVGAHAFYVEIYNGDITNQALSSTIHYAHLNLGH